MILKAPITSLVVAICAALGVGGIGRPAFAATIVPMNCNDSGIGSLRKAVSDASDTDTVDATGLTCSTITLKTGAIKVTQPHLTILGPGQDALTITGLSDGVAEQDRIFFQSGTGGGLDLHDLSVTAGYVVNSGGLASGGCILSYGYVHLHNIKVFNCSANTDSNFALGGGVSANGGLLMYGSTLSNNVADGGAGGSSYGGGARANLYLVARYSTISGNQAIGTSGTHHGFGGGLYSSGSLELAQTTVSGNRASFDGGGVSQFYLQNAPSIELVVQDSTIANNSAEVYAGGISGDAANILIVGSTIASNSSGGSNAGAAGLSVYQAMTSVKVTLQSNLIANNFLSVPSTHADFSTSTSPFIKTSVSISGANNLIRVTTEAVPSDTLKNICPLLGPLGDNGGPTKTMALLSRSPGIDQGNTFGSLPFDQRSSPFARVSGLAADIGAYEVQQDDIVFNSSFDGCSQ